MLALLLAPPVLAPASRAESPSLFTLADSGTTAARSCTSNDDGCDRLMVSWGRRGGRCLARLPDGRVLLCARGDLLALGVDGRMRRRAPTVLRRAVGAVIDVDVLPSGSAVVLGRRGLALIEPHGRVSRIATPFRTASGVAALPGGGLALSRPRPRRGMLPVLVFLSAGGRVVGRVRTLGGRSWERVSDMAGLSDGSVVAATDAGRVIGLAPTGPPRVLAGGGRREVAPGAPATEVDLGSVQAVAVRADGRILVGARPGLLLLSADGTLEALAAGDPHDFSLFAGDPRAVGLDVRPVGALRLPSIRRVDTIDGEHPHVLLDSWGPRGGTQLAVLTPPEDLTRLAVGFAPTTRATLTQTGEADIVSTQAAAARVEVRRGRTVLTTRDVALAPGVNRVPVAFDRDPEVHLLRPIA